MASLTAAPKAGQAARPTRIGNDRNSIRYLKYLLVCSLVVPAIMFAGMAWQDRRQVLRDVELRLGHTAAILHEHALKVFETHELVLDQVAQRVQGMDWDEIRQSADLHAYLQDLEARYNQIDSIALADAEGNVQAVSRLFPARPVNVADRDYFEQAKAGHNGTYISQVSLSRTTGNQQFNIVRPLRSQTGELRGVVIISVYPSYFINFYNAITPDPVAGAISLMRQDGALLVRSPPAPAPSMVLSSQSGIMQAIRHADRGVVETVAQADGVERIYAYRKIAGYPVYVAVGFSRQFAIGEWYRDLVVFGLSAGPAALGMFLVTLLALRRALNEQVAVLRWQEAARSLEGEVERRKAVEAALRESEARYRAYFDNTAESLFVIEVTPAGRFIFEMFNPAHERATGLSNAMLWGKAVDELLTPEQSAAVNDNYRRCIAAGGPIRYEETLDLPGGTRSWETILVPIADAGGRVVKILGSARDITERRQAEERLAQAQKMETIGQLTGGVAHDFNNLLTAIINNLELTRADAPGAPAQQERIAAALKGARAAAALTRQLLAFARKQPLQPEPVDLNHLIGCLLTLISRSCGENVSIRTDLAAELRVVLADRNQTETALLNLVVNACDAMPNGGVLTIATANRTVPVEDRPGEVPPGAYVVLTVADTGTGMPPEVAARIFEPFYTTKPIGKGTGLGLSMVYGFVRQTGGQVRVESESGKGTRMMLYFPAAAPALPRASPRPPEHMPAATAAEPRAPAPAAAPQADAAAGGARATILLVEDEALVRMSVVDLLEQLGYAVIDTGTAAEALAILDRQPGIALLLTDIGLPGMNGHALAAEARRRRPQLKIVLMTGYDRTAVGERLTLDADTACLEKPFESGKLTATLEALLAPAAVAGPAQ